MMLYVPTEAEFAARAEQHRRELHVHCYRMLGSFDEAEDLVQETLLRAWRRRDDLEHDEWFRAWLYRIATNACLDAIKAKRPAAAVGRARSRELPWLQPYPDLLLERRPDGPRVVVERETIELAFLAVIQQLPPRQRAVLILRDVIGWPAAEVAELLEIGVAAVNSALQRARETLQRAAAGRSPRGLGLPEVSETERRLLEGFMATPRERRRRRRAGAAGRRHPRHDAAAPDALRGPQRDRRPDAQRSAGVGEWRLVPTRANRLPAAASYCARTRRRHVPRLQGRRAAGGATAGSPRSRRSGRTLFPVFGLAETL